MIEPIMLEDAFSVPSRACQAGRAKPGGLPVGFEPKRRSSGQVA
jgi:hypothetical protein